MSEKLLRYGNGPASISGNAIARIAVIIGCLMLVLWTPSLLRDRYVVPSTIPLCPGTHDGVQCGFVEVPKDYTASIPGFSLLAYARSPSRRKPSKGTIFVLDGGPGTSGRDFVRHNAPLLSDMLGDNWDVVGFDPRGVGESIPRLRCFSSDMEYQLFKANTVLEQGISPPNNTLPSALATLSEQYRQLLMLKEIEAAACQHQMGDELMYLGTTNIAKDVQFMKQFFDPAGKINFWGMGYGALVGAYIVNLFPQNIGLVTLDSVVDPVEWSSSSSTSRTSQTFSQADSVYRTFLRQCTEAGSQKCPMTRYGQTSSDLERKLDLWFKALEDSPKLVPNGSRPGYLTNGGAHSFIYSLLQKPYLWQKGSHVLDQALSGDAVALYNDLISPLPASKEPMAGPNDRALSALVCPDYSTNKYWTAEELAQEGLKALNVSRFALSSSKEEAFSGCQYWPVRAKRPFHGPFNATLERPMLLVANTADPVAAIEGTMHLHHLMQNSTSVLINDVPGHGTLTTARNPCVVERIKEYFGGIPPINGTMCPFPGSMFP